jgi:cell division protein FtsI (penicillin-binding protein 3)
MASPTRFPRARRRPPVGRLQQFLRLFAQTMPVEATPTRLLLVWLLLLGAIALLGLNLFRLQVVDAPKLQERAKDQQQFLLRPFMPRREIVDRSGAVVAIDRPVYVLYAHPKLFKQSKAEVAAQLAPILQKSAQKIETQLNEAESGIRLVDDLAEDLADRVLDLNLDGLERLPQQRRLYPQKDLLASLVGFVNQDEHKGQGGLEASQEHLLERQTKSVHLSRMGDGSLMPDQMPGGFMNIDDLKLHLTVDSRLQRIAQTALKQQMKQFNAKRGTVVVMDATDGSVLSLVTEPSFDPNRYYKFPVERFKSWAITDLYEPGSTFKPLNVAIALEAGAIRPDSVFNDEGQIIIDQWPIQNFDFSSAGPRGPSTVSQILEKSSNVGMVRIVQQMQPTVYYDWLKKLGLGEASGIDLPSEVPGQFLDQKTFAESPVEPATTAFGQGFSLTPIQLARMHAALANGGILVSPHVVSGVFDSQGRAYWKPDLRAAERIFSQSTADTVVRMMGSVVDNGTGKSAQIPGYSVAGKTGTAQKAVDGGYHASAKITSFVSIFPADSPRYVILAVVDEPQGADAFGSTVAAPVVKTVIQDGLIGLEKIPPSRPINPPNPQEAQSKVAH